MAIVTLSSFLKNKSLALAFASVLTLSACEGSRLFPAEQPIESKSAEQIYSDAQSAQRAGKGEEAAELYLEIERLHPYSALASDAQLLAAKQYYDLQDYDSAANAADRFIQLRPADDRVSFAYYIKALSLFDQIAETDRGQEATRKAKVALESLTRRFPETKYGLDAAIKLDLVNEQLAGAEMEVARYYLLRGRNLAAVNRYNQVVDKFETTSHVEEALYRMVEAYLALGLRKEASRAAEILSANYPASRWYAKTYRLMNGESPERRGWFR